MSLVSHRLSEYIQKWYDARSTTCPCNVCLPPNLDFNNIRTPFCSNINPQMFQTFIISLGIHLLSSELPFHALFFPVSTSHNSHNYEIDQVLISLALQNQISLTRRITCLVYSTHLFVQNARHRAHFEFLFINFETLNFHHQFDSCSYSLTSIRAFSSAPVFIIICVFYHLAAYDANTTL